MSTRSHFSADHCLTIEMLQAALQDRLDERTQENLERHLVGCESCRTQFERLAGEASFWEQASETLKRAAMETSADIGWNTSHNSKVFMRLDSSAEGPRIESVFHGDSDDVTRERLEAFLARGSSCSRGDAPQCRTNPLSQRLLHPAVSGDGDGSRKISPETH